MWASDELKGNSELVLKAVSQNGAALEFASSELKGDREIILEAVTQDPPGEPTGRGYLENPNLLKQGVQAVFLCGNSIWSFPFLSSLSDYSIWRS